MTGQCVTWTAIKNIYQHWSTAPSVVQQNLRHWSRMQPAAIPDNCWLFCTVDPCSNVESCIVLVMLGAMLALTPAHV